MDLKLGHGASMASTAINFARTLKAAWDRCNGNISTIAKLTNNDLEEMSLRCARQLFSISDESMELVDMLSLPWFERALVIQEVAVSKIARIHWGNEVFNWDDLVNAIFFVVRVEVTFTIDYSALMRRVLFIADENFGYGKQKNRLLPVLLWHRSCQATDPLDKVYTFLALTKRGPSFVPLDID